MTEDILSKNTPRMPGKATVVVTLICTEVVLMHRCTGLNWSHCYSYAL